MAFIYDLTDTWNAGGTTFSAIKMNVTDTASAAASKLVQCQVGGTDKFTVRKDGFTDINGNLRLSASNPAIELNTGGPQVYVPAANTFAIATGGGIGSPIERVRVDSSGNVGIGTSSPSAALDVAKSSGNLYLRDGTTGNASIFMTAAGSSYAEIQAASFGISFNMPLVLQRQGGNVGVGTSSPSNQLSVAGNNSATISFDWTGDNAAKASIAANHSTGEVRYTAVTNYFPTFYSNNAERMRIDSSGNLLVGTSSTFDNVSYLKMQSLGGLATKIAGTSSTSQVSFFNDNGRVGYIGTSGTTTSYNTSSDYRLKDIDGPLSNSGAYIDALKPVQGSWKADGSRFIGLLAHEVQEVSETKIATGEKDGEEMQAMDYSAPELIANLIAEVQSLRARVAELETSASTITFEG